MEEKNKIHKIRTIEESFEILWKQYPSKKGKIQITKVPRLLKKIHDNFDLYQKALDKYLDDEELISNGGWRNFMNGSRFFKEGYLDYLEED